MIINLTNHKATAEQVAQGVIEPKQSVSELLTFVEIPSKTIIARKAAALVKIARDAGAECAMIGGAPYLMPALTEELENQGIKPVFAFSRRRSVEITNEKGEVEKKSIFVHEGFVEV